MPESRIILHVKGTDSETTELPKDAVREALSQGQITQSQLIWSAADNAWKQVKEAPELLQPTERLILHVKGTEAETKELPKKAVREAISQGQITQSQLIWSVPDNSWKQVKELPDLLPADRLILHVKGTEAETKELPKQAVRAAISQGQISHSQLIWSSSDSAWKQVRELPELLPSQKLAPAPAREPVVHAPKVAEAVRQEPAVAVPRVAASVPHVRVADASANVPHVRAAEAPVATPQVRVATPAADVPQARVAGTSTAVPQARVSEAPTVAASQVRAAETPTAKPQVRVSAASAETPAVRAKAPDSVPSAHSHVVTEEDEGHPLKWVCIGLGVLIVLVLGGNYLLVDRPLVSALGQTSYSDVTVVAHLGAFMQPNVMVIHIPSSAKITPDTLTDFMVALAHSTPQSPVTRDLYDRVALTSGWTAQYSFSGGSWKQLGDMDRDSAAARKEFLMSTMGDASGQPLVESTLNEAARQEKRDKAWSAFVAHFTSKP